MLYKSTSRTAQWIIPARGSIPEFMEAEFPGITPVAVGRRLRLTRDALRMTQKEFGRLAGISASAMNNIERGRNFPTIPNCVALKSAHDLTLEWICEGNIRKLRLDLVEAIRALENVRAAPAGEPPRAA